jgi:hypothetical protein
VEGLPAKLDRVDGSKKGSLIPKRKQLGIFDGPVNGVLLRGVSRYNQSHRLKR